MDQRFQSRDLGVTHMFVQDGEMLLSTSEPQLALGDETPNHMALKLGGCIVAGGKLHCSRVRQGWDAGKIKTLAELLRRREQGWNDEL